MSGTRDGGYWPGARRSMRGDFPDSIRFVGRQDGGRAHMVRRWDNSELDRAPTPIGYCGQRIGVWEFIVAPQVRVCQRCYVSSAIVAEKY